eukprot:43919-Chlamydomonas_euryale.AAC.1
MRWGGGGEGKAGAIFGVRAWLGGMPGWAACGGREGMLLAEVTSSRASQSWRPHILHVLGWLAACRTLPH